MSSLDSMKEIRKQYGWRMDHLVAEIRREVIDMADDAEHIRAAIENEWNINGFDHSRGSRGSKLDSLIAKRAQLAEVLHDLDYHIKADEAEEAAQ